MSVITIEKRKKMDNNQNIIIGKRLKELRIANDMEQQYVAHMMGYKSDTTISKWENGKNLPNGGKLAKLAQLFNTTTDYILHGSTTIPNTTPPILSVYNKLVPQRQQNVLTYANEQLDEQERTETIKVISIDELKEQDGVYLTSEPQTEYETVDLYGKISAGTGLNLYDEVIETISYPKPVPNHDIALRVHGDSMTPLFQDEEVVFIKKSSEIYNGQIGAFIINSQGFLKKYYKENDGIRLVSLNKAYKDIIVGEFDEVHLVGTVVL